MFNIKNLLMLGALILLVVLGTKLLNRKSHGPDNSDPEANLAKLNSIKADIVAPLPEAGRMRTFVNPDQINKGNNYISALFEYETKEEDKVPEFVAKFIYNGYQKILQENVGNFSALTIAILIKGTNRQYRVILGSNIARRKDAAFWNQGDQTALYAWLAEECPRSNPQNLPDFCNLSDLLNPSVDKRHLLQAENSAKKEVKEPKKVETKKPAKGSR